MAALIKDKERHSVQIKLDRPHYEKLGKIVRKLKEQYRTSLATKVLINYIINFNLKGP